MASTFIGVVSGVASIAASGGEVPSQVGTYVATP